MNTLQQCNKWSENYQYNLQLNDFQWHLQWHDWFRGFNVQCTYLEIDLLFYSLTRVQPRHFGVGHVL